MIIPDARSTSDMTNANKNLETGVAFTKVVIDAINTSVGSKTNSATFSVSGKAGADVMSAIQDLRRKGFKLTQVGTDVTVSW